jgi:hypothetical protein
MAYTTRVTVSRAHVDALRTALLAAYGVKLDALHHALPIGQDDRQRPEALREHRRELTDLEALIECVGWSGDQAQAGGEGEVELVGRADLLCEAVHAALRGAADELARRCELRRPDLASVEEAIEDVRGLVALLAKLADDHDDEQARGRHAEP